MIYGGSRALNVAYFEGVAMAGVATPSSVFLHLLQWDPEAHVRYIWRLLDASRLSASVFHRRVDCHPEALAYFTVVVTTDVRLRFSNIVLNGIRMASSGVVAMTGVSTIGVGFSTSCPTASRGSYSLNMASFGCVWTIGVPTLVDGLS
jgi:hypothetical protein